MFNAIEYFRKIAIQHVKLQHTAGKPAFFREFSAKNVIFGESDFLEAVRKAGDYLLVVDWNGDGALTRVDWDRELRVYSGAIMLLRRVKIHDWDGIEAARQELLEIWDDIYAKIKKDIEDCVIPIQNIEVNFHSIGRIHDGWYGIAVFLNFTEPYEAEYRGDVWQ